MCNRSGVEPGREFFIVIKDWVFAPSLLSYVPLINGRQRERVVRSVGWIALGDILSF